MSIARLLKIVILGATLVVQPLVTLQASPPRPKVLPASQMKIIPNLSFVSFMREFYADKMFPPTLKEGVIEDEILGNIQVHDIPTLDDDTKYYEHYAVMHPVFNYKNSKGELRYVVVIEYVTTDRNGDLINCQICGGSVDIFTFRKLENSSFQLASKTAEPLDIGGWGRVMFDDWLVEPLTLAKPIAPNLIGGFYFGSGLNQGVTSGKFFAIHIPDSGFIDKHTITSHNMLDGSGNSGAVEENSPLHYSYWTTANFVGNSSNEYFDIELHTKGDMPIDDNYQNIRAVNYKKTYRFNPVRGKYVQVRR